MKITAIKQQVKRQGRYSIFVEGKYAFSLSDVALLESKLVNGQVLNDKEIGEYKQRSVDDKIYNNALNYLAIRPRSIWEMSQYLRRKDCPPALAESLINKLSQHKLLDDTAFAWSWVNNRRMLRPTSLRRLKQELRAKGVADDVIQQVLAEDETDEKQVLQQLIARKRRQTRYQDDQKLMQYLVGQGFSYGDIKEVLAAS